MNYGPGRSGGGSKTVVDFNDLAIAVMTTRPANMMRQFQLATIRTFNASSHTKAIMRSPLVTP